MKILLPTFGLFALALSGPVWARQDDATWVCPHFSEITKKAEIDAFEAKSKSMATSMDLFKYGEQFMDAVRKQHPQDAQNIGFRISGAGNSQFGKLFSLDHAPQTPLREGFQMRIDYQTYDGKVLTRYVKTKTEYIRSRPRISNLNVAAFASVPHYIGFNLTILLDDPKATYRLTAKFFPDYWAYDAGV